MSLELYQKRIRILQEDLSQVIAEALNEGHSAMELFSPLPPAKTHSRVKRDKPEFDL